MSFSASAALHGCPAWTIATVHKANERHGTDNVHSTGEKTYGALTVANIKATK